MVLGHNPVDQGPNPVGQNPGVEMCGRILAKNPKLADLTETRRVCHNGPSTQPNDLGPKPVDLGPNPVVLGPNPVDL